MPKGLSTLAKFVLKIPGTVTFIEIIVTMAMLALATFGNQHKYK